MPPIHRVKINLNLQQFLVLYINKQSERGEREGEIELKTKSKINNNNFLFHQLYSSLIIRSKLFLYYCYFM
jgi:hypothetical protein